MHGFASEREKSSRSPNFHAENNAVLPNRLRIAQVYKALAVEAIAVARLAAVFEGLGI